MGAKKLPTYGFAPIENINKAIKEFGLTKVIQAINKIGDSSYMRETTNIDNFFNKNKNDII